MDCAHISSSSYLQKEIHLMTSSLVFFLLLLVLHFVYSSTASPLPLPSKHLGHPDECNALLQFSNSLTINPRFESREICNPLHLNWTSRLSTTSWRNGTDCCTWDGIYCNNVTGNVIKIDLSCSHLQGTLLSNSTLFSLPHIVFLHLGGNNLSGHIPTSICQKSSLEFLSFKDNRLSGTIPPCLGNLSNLQALELNDNQIQGPLPRSLANCTMLEALYLSYNEITDTFPHWLKTLPLRSLALGGNHFHSLVEPNHNLFPFPRLEHLLSGSNNFSSQLPFEYFLHSNLTFIDLNGNSFIGSMPIPPPAIEYYDIGDNRFTGHIPSLICNATNLVVLEVSINSLTGNIPQCLLNMGTSLEVLHLAINELQSTIRETHAPNNCSLKSIALNQNHLTGRLPRSLVRCKSLEILDLSHNELEDSFPNWLETLPTLHLLSLRANKFLGPINRPLVIHPFPKLHIFDISHNSFCGDIPTQYIVNFNDMRGGDKGQGNLKFFEPNVINIPTASLIIKGVEWAIVPIPKSFISIDISRNNFQGEIPEEIGNLTSVIGLNFSHNKLTGPIPSSIGNLADLEWLDLSSNYLTGPIPEALADLSFLALLNLSSNQLTGPIPQGKQFDTFKINSFTGNPGLCGTPLPTACGVEPKQSPIPTFQEDAELGSWVEWQALPMGYGCGLVLGIFAGFMALHIGRPLWFMRMIENKIYSLQTRPRRTRIR